MTGGQCDGASGGKAAKAAPAGWWLAPEIHQDELRMWPHLDGITEGEISEGSDRRAAWSKRTCSWELLSKLGQRNRWLFKGARG